ncbi:MAG: dihydrodipicolinate synthase family protein, partial [Candidatus Eremiobacteraeota bacterium]|nr:dihydrodipicolinate synthase family protein [Candidatus Eremiobacteraeota bacterium]
MQVRTPIHGVVAAIATPVDAAFQPDTAALVAHARWLLEHGCDGLNVLGTTGGFASFSAAERIGVMRALAEAGLP